MCDGEGRPVALCLTEGQMSDHKGAKLLYPALPEGPAVMIGDKACPELVEGAMTAMNIALRLKPRASHQASRRERDAQCPPTATHNSIGDTQLYRQRHKIENLFARLKDWRRIHTRYDRRAETFMAAITIAAICAC